MDTTTNGGVELPRTKWRCKPHYLVIRRVYGRNIKKFGQLTCEYCLRFLELGEEHVDHKKPVVKGGSNHGRNLCIACVECNKKKLAKSVKEFMKSKYIILAQQAIQTTK